MIHGQWSVCCGDCSRWISTADGNWRQDFYDPPTFHSSDHLTQNGGQRFLVPAVSAFPPSLPCLSLWISAFLTQSFSAFWLTKGILLKSRKPDDLKPLQAERLFNVLLSVTCRQEKESSFITTSRIWKKICLVCLFFEREAPRLQLCILCFQKSMNSLEGLQQKEL